MIEGRKIPSANRSIYTRYFTSSNTRLPVIRNGNRGKSSINSFASQQSFCSLDLRISQACSVFEIFVNLHRQKKFTV